MFQSATRVTSLLAVVTLAGGLASAAPITTDLVGASKDASARATGFTDFFNSGSGESINIGELSGIQYRGFVQFDLASLGSNINVTSATVMFRVLGEPTGASYNVAVYRLLQDWAEGDGDQNGAGATGGVTGKYPDQASTGVQWGAIGADQAGVDRAASPTVSIDVKAAANRTTVPGVTGQFVKWDVTGDVQDFVDGTTTNHGWLFVGDAGDRLNVLTTEKAGYEPRLRITYELVPEPASVALAGLGSLTLVWRRGR